MSPIHAETSIVEAGTSEGVGLVTGSAPFAGLPSNPASLVLSAVEGMIVDGIRVVTARMPVSYARLPREIPKLLAKHRPRFVMSIGLALGAPVVKVEAMAINAAHFAVPDNEGALPVGGRRFDHQASDGLKATWDAPAVVKAILAAGVPATLSFHAGTHLCNLTLFTFLRALAAAREPAPCGFLHLPYLPEQVVWMMRRQRNSGRRAPLAPTDLPSMALEAQVAAVRAAIGALARQAGGTRSRSSKVKSKTERPS